MDLHVGENFSESEYGLETNYGDYKYFYDYFGDGDFGVLAKIDIDEQGLADQITKEYNNGKIKSDKDAARIIKMWKRNQQTTRDNLLLGKNRQSGLSNNGQGSGAIRANSSSESSEDDRLRNVAIETDAYFKTGADGTNRPRYEIRFSINTSNLKQKWFAQMDAMRKKNEEALNERNRLRFDDGQFSYHC